MIEVAYPGNLLEFYKLIVNLSELDLLQGPTHYEKIFDFRPTLPYTENFDQFGTGDMNFFFNSGSIPIILVIIFINFLIMFFLLSMAVKRYSNYRWRQVGMRASQDIDLRGSVLRVFYEGYPELFLAASLTCTAIASTIDAPGPSYWFLTRSDCINSVVAILSMLLLLAMPIAIFFAGNRLKRPEYD